MSSAHLQRHCRRRSSAPRFWFEARVDVSRCGGGCAIVLPSRSCSSLAVCKLFSRIESVNSIYFYNYSTVRCLCLFAGLYSYHGRERASQLGSAKKKKAAVVLRRAPSLAWRGPGWCQICVAWFNWRKASSARTRAN